MHSTVQISLFVVNVTNVSDGCSELLLKVWFLDLFIIKLYIIFEAEWPSGLRRQNQAIIYLRKVS